LFDIPAWSERPDGATLVEVGRQASREKALAEHDVKIRLEDRYTADSGDVQMTGVQALARLPMNILRSDSTAGLKTAVFISGYEGSPLGGYDLELQRHAELLASYDLVFALLSASARTPRRDITRGIPPAVACPALSASSAARCRLPPPRTPPGSRQGTAAAPAAVSGGAHPYHPVSSPGGIAGTRQCWPRHAPACRQGS
jgi:hypothetical protein